VGNKRQRFNGDMESTFKKLTKSSKTIETLKLELQREVIETTKSIAQSMIAIEKRSRKESRNQTLQLAQILATKFKVKRLPDV
jgi:septal ring factor EnvC (AmiA/AmiB activator)